MIGGRRECMAPVHWWCDPRHSSKQATAKLKLGHQRSKQTSRVLAPFAPFAGVAMNRDQSFFQKGPRWLQRAAHRPCR